MVGSSSTRRRQRVAAADPADAADDPGPEDPDGVEGELMGSNLSRYARSTSRVMKQSPDHVASTAQTLTSTSPVASPRSRTTLSSRSVATPEARLGQQSQSRP